MTKQPKDLGDLLEVAKRLETQIASLALLQMADEFYTKERRAQLYAEYDGLEKADAEAYRHMQEIQKSNPEQMSWEARVEKYGETRAAEQLAPFVAAHEAKKACAQKITEFEREHRLIVHLLRAKKSLGTYDYERL